MSSSAAADETSSGAAAVESSIPAASSLEETVQPRVVHTISSSQSFDDADNVTGNDESMPPQPPQQHIVRLSPSSGSLRSLKSDRSFSSETNLVGLGNGRKPRRTNSVGSFASGELVLSDSNDSQTQTQTQTQTPVVVDTSASPTNASNDPLESPASSYDGEAPTLEEDSSEDYGEDSEDDSEVLLAKEMALAIAKNPTMTPAQLRELQQQVQQTVVRRQSERQLQKEAKKKKKRSKKLSASKISEEMKSNYKKMNTNVKEAVNKTRSDVKEAVNKTKSNAKAGANHIRKEAKKGLRAAGLMKESRTTDSTTSIETTATTTTSRGLPPTRPLSPVEAYSGHTTSASTVGNDTEDGETIRLNAIIWKRRSGLGKYSMTAPWERRRVTLQGTRLIYYKNLEADGDDDDESTSERGDLDTTVLASGGSGASDDTMPWFNTFMDKNGISIPWESSTSYKGARGYLDLKKEKASASASYGHTGAPTPFALSIKVATTTKYKFCFDTQQELMQWLAAITDVVVEGSVDAYNAEILEANDPSAHGDPMHTIAQSTGIAWQEPSPKNALATSKASPPEGGGGHQLWSTERYVVASENTPVGNARVSSPAQSLAAQDTPQEVVGASPDDYMLDKDTGTAYVALPAQYMWNAIYLMNLFVLAARHHPAMTEEVFFNVLVFMNVLGVFFVQKVQVGGSIRLKPELVGSAKKPKDLLTAPSAGGLPTIASMDSTGDEAPDENFVPPAGSTSIRIENPTDLPTKDGVVFAGWREIDASELMVRGCGYKTNKTKVPAPNSLYRCVDLDVFESKARVPDMAGRVVLPSVDFDDGDLPKTWNAPDIFVVTVALPTDPPKLYGGSTDNGGGYTITMYCVMRQETRDILRRVTADGYNPNDDAHKADPNKSMVNAVKLFDEWCRRAPSDDNWMARFKVVPQGNNLVEIGLPAWISNYNGKPFLIKRPGTTGFLYRHPDQSCMEFDVSLHPFPYLAKQGICYMKDGFFKKILATLAFCIEGRSDDELPECLIGLYQLCYPNPVHAIQAEEFFAGKSARSK